jgi:error-prone DNA polymerase
MSFLQGASPPGALVAEAHQLGIGVLAVTDRDGLYAARRHSEAAKAKGVATVIGAELTLPAPLGPVLVLARDLDGFSRLGTVISAAQLAGSKGHPVYDLDQVAQAHGGHWAVLTGCPAPDLDPAAAAERLHLLVDYFGAAHVYAELVDHRLPADGPRNDALVAAAHRLGTEVVATGAVHYARPGQARLAQALTALRRNESLERAAAHLPAAPTAHLRSGAEMRRLFARYPGVVESTVALGRELTIDLAGLHPELPGAEVPAGHTEDSWLRHLAERAAATRYGPRHRADTQIVRAWRQLDHELGVIEQLGMAGYFLIVHDITKYAASVGIWCQGRGSAANSVVCYVLGITNADPIRHNLLFERFLSPERDGPPDIDLDFEHRRREEIIQYCYRKYGRTHCAQVANLITYRPRLAVRDAARALGYSPTEIDALTRYIDSREPSKTEDSLPADVRRLAAGLDRLPRHLGVHSGGMVITRRPIAEIMPVEWATAEGRTVVQGDKEDVAAADLTKIDLLALGFLSAAHDACTMIADFHGVHLDLASVPQDDEGVYDMICAGDTIGTYQLESRAMIGTLPRLRPRSLADIVVAVSLIRPGPIQGNAVHPYLRRRAGREPVTYPHPLAEPALKRSLGVALWQEQMMHLAVDCAGLTTAEADQLRSAMSAKRSVERVAAMRRQLLDGMAARGIPPAAAEQLSDMIQAFSDYGFPESHAQSMAHISCVSAWLKHHYPSALLAGLLANQPMGFYGPLSLIHDAKRHGVVVHGVDVLRSGAQAVLEPDPASAGGAGVRLGLATVRRLGATAAQEIVDLRAEEPFSDLEDFILRTRLPVKVLEALAIGGAFTCFGLSRRTALWTVGMPSRTDPGMLPGTAPGPTPPPLPAMTPIEETRSDLWATGATPGAHPVRYERESLTRDGVRSAVAVRDLADRARVTLGGLITHVQRPPTAHGVSFVNLEDETGMTNVIVPLWLWERGSRTVTDHAGLLVHGTVERRDGALNVLAHRLEPLPLTALPETRRSAPGHYSRSRT